MKKSYLHPGTDSATVLSGKISMCSSSQHYNEDNKPCILVAEDYPANVLVATAILDHFGLAYETVDNGKSAVEAVKKGGFSMVLMDVQMPQLDGFAATHQIREYERNHALPRIPIVGVTAFALSGDREKCLAAGMDDYISKPFSEDQLKRCINAHVIASREVELLAS